ncbi:endonuclease domain-containing protein [Pseudokineococcus lusitanus]|uniref:Uncharacterized protein DUF559 n=1 Tax=Pseudokineococcus lusitanus TaxID=763993 RepID=A0A3N1GWH4_9ACTN|nr:DUF559 domain-containing protein [Pseudokineococcus lusitanus]ROP34588.1 uncharacterized protein DUF559 [Pseudokineococcus lusitanus]
MPRPPLPQHLVGVPLRTGELLAHVSRRQVAGPAFRSVVRGVHVNAGTSDDHRVRATAALRALRGDAVLGGLSAAWVHGVPEARPDEPVLVLCPRPAPRSRPPLLVVQQADLPPADVVATRWGAATSPTRTVVDLLRSLPMPRALCVAEALAHRLGLGVDDVAAQLARQRGARGLGQARRRLALLDPRAESPRETALRLLLLDAGLPPPVPQHEVYDTEGRFVARLDLAWPALRVAVEYDGAHHRDARQHSRDLARHNRLRALGWTVLQVDARVLAAPEELLRLLGGLLVGA